jgi:predicted TPR repeat methyltransferase
MLPGDGRARATAAVYDDSAEAVGWFGPEIAFGLAYKYVHSGKSILDIGIGTGLAATLFRAAGLRVLGMDLDQRMLDACRTKGFDDLTHHDLTLRPYPHDTASIDHAVCVGTLNFVADLAPVFAECSRILRGGGVFIFAVGDRAEDEPAETVVDAERTGTGEPATMYRHSARQVEAWAAANRFTPLRSLTFAVPLDRERTSSQQITMYVVRKGEGA